MAVDDNPEGKLDERPRTLQGADEDAALDFSNGQVEVRHEPLLTGKKLSNPKAACRD